MDSLYHYCQGESHKATDKPCQDCAYAESNESLSMAIVCDGHGGERYFRSQHGSDFAVNITKNAIHDFVKEMDSGQFVGASFTEYSKEKSSAEQENTPTHRALMWLFSSIISQWNNAIARDAAERPISEWEEAHVEAKYLDEFKEKLTKDPTTVCFEKTYGCTLMAYVQTPNYWFAFHLGDGKCVMMQDVDGKLECSQPIPWDERCFLNKTTSLCDSNALEEFRYCYEGDGKFPLAMFLGSDGMDDSYGDGENLNNFYIQLFKIILNKGKDKALEELRRDLPKISKVGSKDDMSVVAVFDDSDVRRTFELLTDYQMNALQQSYSDLQDKINGLEKKIMVLTKNYKIPAEELSNHDRVTLQYALSDIEKARHLVERNKKRTTSLKCEITKFKNKSV